MASLGRVAGLKIELEIDGSKVTRSLETQARKVEKVKKSLKDLEKSLKLNPKNTDLLNQKFKLLGEGIKETEKYLKQLKQGFQDLANKKDPTKADIERMDKLQREISDTEKELRDLKKAYQDFSTEGQRLKATTEESAKALQDVRSRLEEVKRSLKLNPASTELLKQKFNLLGDQVRKTKTHLANLRTEYDKLAETKYKTEEQRLRMEALGREISDTEQKLKELTREFRTFSVVGEQVKAVGQMVQDVGQRIQDVGRNVEALGRDWQRLGLPLQVAFGLAAKESIGFEQSMAEVQAVTNASVEDFNDLRTTALELSKTTKYSADETAEGLKYMGLAGWEAKESIAALPGVLDLAAAGGIDLGHASSIIVDGMTAMGYAASGTTNGIANATHFTNVMAAAMANSNTTVELLGESFKYAAPLAGTLGYSIEDLTLGLGLMASAGIKGSQAGTGLRMAFKNMASPTEKQLALMDKFNIKMDDGYGKALPLRDVIYQLRDNFGGLNLELLDAEGNLKSGEQLMEEYGDSLPATQMEKFAAVAEIVGVRALPGVLGMINATEEDFKQLTSAIDGANTGFFKIDGEILDTENAMKQTGLSVRDLRDRYQELGYAEAMRERQMGTTQGQLIQLKDNFIALGIELGSELIPYIKDFIGFLNGLVEKFRKLSPQTKRMIVMIAGIVAAIGPALVVVGKVIAAVGTVIKTIGLVISGIGTLIGWISAIVGAVGALPVVIGAIVIGLIAFIVTHWQEFKQAMHELWISIVELFTGIWVGLKSQFLEIWEKLKEKFFEIVEGIREKWEGFKEQLAGSIQFIKDKLEQWRQYFHDIAEKIKEKVEDLKQKWEDFKQRLSEIIERIKEKIEDLRQKWEDFKQRIGEIVAAIKERVEDLKEKIREKIEKIKEKIELLKEKWEELKQKVIDIKDSIVEKVEDLKSKIDAAFKKIQEFMEDPIGSAKKFIDEKIEAIKNLFPISIGNIFSNIKLPSFDIGWKDIGGFSIPTFDISWHAKAMDKGVLLDGATIFGYQNGKFLGGGEAGREWIVGENGLQSMIRNEVSRNQLSPEVIYNAVVAGMEAANVNVYMDSDRVTRKITKTISAQQASMLRFNGV